MLQYIHPASPWDTAYWCSSTFSSSPWGTLFIGEAVHSASPWGRCSLVQQYIQLPHGILLIGAAVHSQYFWGHWSLVQQYIQLPFGNTFHCCSRIFNFPLGTLFICEALGILLIGAAILSASLWIKAEKPAPYFFIFHSIRFMHCYSHYSQCIVCTVNCRKHKLIYC
jgi:hypothetical protein